MELNKFIIKIKDQKYYFFYKKNKKKDDSKYFQGILSGKVYKKINLDYKINIILDIGANVGSTSIFFSINYPQSTIFSFEPVTETYEILKKNISNFNNIHSYKYAISDKDDFQRIYIDENRLGRSSLIKKHRNMENTNTEIVQLVNLNSFLRNNNIEKIDILKIDCEGSEVEILESIKTKLDKIALIYIEIHGEEKIEYLTKLLSKTHNEIAASDYIDLRESIFINKIFKTKL